jgi:hypothetical protein
VLSVLNHDIALTQIEAITTLNGRETFNHEHVSATWALMTFVNTWHMHQMFISMITYSLRCVIIYVFCANYLINGYYCALGRYGVKSSQNCMFYIYSNSEKYTLLINICIYGIFLFHWYFTEEILYLLLIMMGLLINVL